MDINASMEVPILKRQVAEKEMGEIPLLRQYDIPPEVETMSSPKPEALEPDTKVDGIAYMVHFRSIERI